MSMDKDYAKQDIQACFDRHQVMQKQFIDEQPTVLLQYSKDTQQYLAKHDTLKKEAADQNASLTTTNRRRPAQRPPSDIDSVPQAPQKRPLQQQDCPPSVSSASNMFGMPSHPFMPSQHASMHRAQLVRQPLPSGAHVIQPSGAVAPAKRMRLDQQQQQQNFIVKQEPGSVPPNLPPDHPMARMPFPPSYLQHQQEQQQQQQRFRFPTAGTQFFPPGYGPVPGGTPHPHYTFDQVRVMRPAHTQIATQVQLPAGAANVGQLHPQHQHMIQQQPQHYQHRPSPPDVQIVEDRPPSLVRHDSRHSDAMQMTPSPARVVPSNPATPHSAGRTSVGIMQEPAAQQQTDNAVNDLLSNGAPLDIAADDLDRLLGGSTKSVLNGSSAGPPQSLPSDQQQRWLSQQQQRAYAQASTPPSTAATVNRVVAASQPYVCENNNYSFVQRQQQQLQQQSIVQQQQTVQQQQRSAAMQQQSAAILQQQQSTAMFQQQSTALQQQQLQQSAVPQQQQPAGVRQQRPGAPLHYLETMCASSKLQPAASTPPSVSFQQKSTSKVAVPNVEVIPPQRPPVLRHPAAAAMMYAQQQQQQQQRLQHPFQHQHLPPQQLRHQLMRAQLHPSLQLPIQQQLQNGHHQLNGAAPPPPHLNGHHPYINGGMPGVFQQSPGVLSCSVPQAPPGDAKPSTETLAASLASFAESYDDMYRCDDFSSNALEQQDAVLQS